MHSLQEKKEKECDLIFSLRIFLESPCPLSRGGSGAAIATIR